MNEEDEKLLHPTIASRAVTQHILKAFGLHASKKLGQNFLIDAGIVRGIVEAAVAEISFTEGEVCLASHDIVVRAKAVGLFETVDGLADATAGEVACAEGVEYLLLGGKHTWGGIGCALYRAECGLIVVVGEVACDDV